MISQRKEDLRKEIARRERELEKLEALPDFEEVADGSVLGMMITLGRSKPYAFVAYKVRGLWYLTGKNSPNGVSSDALSDWLTTGGRRLELAAALAEFAVETVAVDAIDVAALLDGLVERPTRRRGSDWRAFAPDLYDSPEG